MKTRIEQDFAAAERQGWLRKIQRPFIVRESLWRRRAPEPGEDRGIPLSRAQLLGAILILLPGVIAGAAWLFSALGWIR